MLTNEPLMGKMYLGEAEYSQYELAGQEYACMLLLAKISTEQQVFFVQVAFLGQQQPAAPSEFGQKFLL